MVIALSLNAKKPQLLRVVGATPITADGRERATLSLQHQLAL
jgi:hypothetical protein